MPAEAWRGPQAGAHPPPLPLTLRPRGRQDVRMRASHMAYTAALALTKALGGNMT
jgi:hypothetical protein